MIKNPSTLRLFKLMKEDVKLRRIVARKVLGYSTFIGQTRIRKAARTFYRKMVDNT